MDELNHQIQNDVAQLRDELPNPDRRRYTIMAKRDHIRVKYDDDAGDLVYNNHLLEGLDELGYRHAGTNFGGRTNVYEPRDE